MLDFIEVIKFIYEVFKHNIIVSAIIFIVIVILMAIWYGLGIDRYVEKLRKKIKEYRKRRKRKIMIKRKFKEFSKDEIKILDIFYEYGDYEMPVSDKINTKSKWYQLLDAKKCIKLKLDSTWRIIWFFDSYILNETLYDNYVFYKKNCIKK